jgi:Carboxypeptidase regulatory-like domain
MLKRIQVHFAAIAVAVAVPIYSAAQTSDARQMKPGTIVGTVVDGNGDTVPGATVVLKGLDSQNGRTLVTSDNGFFMFQDIDSGVPYQITISATNFADWTSPSITLAPGQYKIVSDIQLRIEGERTTVDVHYDPVQVATEQLRREEHQRVLGFFPNFYASYDKNAEPLTRKMKFQLALKVSTDPVTAAGVFFIAGTRQAGNSPKYGQGWDAYGKRVGATAADGFSDIMIGGAILPSLLHQDPRYFYQGTGTTGSRIRHAMLSPFVAKYDNGTWGPNYSSVGGDLASSALANLYFPRANRGVGLLFGNFAIGTAERIGASLAEEFLFGRFTKRGGHVD